MDKNSGSFHKIVSVGDGTFSQWKERPEKGGNRNKLKRGV